jgi:hypothetical protein
VYGIQCIQLSWIQSVDTPGIHRKDSWIQLDTAGDTAGPKVCGLFGCFGVSILPYSGEYLEGMEPILQIKT